MITNEELCLPGIVKVIAMDPARYTIRTPRLLLRPWKESDRASWAALNADPRVMEYFPKTLTQEESDAAFDRVVRHWKDYGFGRFAVEIPGEVAFAGFVGIANPGFEAHFTPCVEIGWRLAFAQQGKGYATEAAHAVMDHAFNLLRIKELYSFTVAANVKSWKVMEKIGMTYVEEFMHPKIDNGHPLKKHLLFQRSNPYFSFSTL